MSSQRDATGVCLTRAQIEHWLSSVGDYGCGQDEYWVPTKEAFEAVCKLALLSLSETAPAQKPDAQWCMEAFWRVNPGRNATVPSLYLLAFAHEVLRAFSSPSARATTACHLCTDPQQCQVNKHCAFSPCESPFPARSK